jgi:hypothetical protein
MTRQIRVLQRDEKGQAAVLELDGADPVQRDAQQAHMIGQHVGHVVGSVMSEAIQHMDTMAEVRRIEVEAQRPPAPPALGEVEAYNFQRRKQKDAEWDARWAQIQADSDASQQRLHDAIERFRNHRFSWEQQ